MAIDTAAKRHSIARFGQAVSLAGLPIPDGTISAADRAGLLWLYSGLALANTVIGPFHAIALQMRTTPALALQLRTGPAIDLQLRTGHPAAQE